MSNLSTQSAPSNLKTMLNAENMRKQFAAALPRHLSADRFCRVATTALMRVKNLSECTQESFFKCLMDLSAWGIEPDGRRAHLIPFKNNRAGTYECTLILDWKGLAELAMRSGIIAKLHADLICENDEFSYDMGEVLHHRINFKAPRGEPYAAYAIAETKDGAKFCQVMTKDEIERIRNNSQGYKSAVQYDKTNPWLSDSGEMWKKTVFRRLSKWLPLSPEFRDAVEREDEAPLIERDVTPSTAAPKFLKPTDIEPEKSPEKEEDEPHHEASPPQPQPEAAPLPNNEAERTELLRKIKDAQDEDAVTTTQVREWAFAQKLAQSDKLALRSLPIESLRAIVDRWTELKEAVA